MLRNLCSHTSSATTFFASAFPLSVTVAHKPSPCLAGARLSGVSLLNPGAGHGPVSLPEAFGGNRRLYTLAAPAADPFVGPPVDPRPNPPDRFICILRWMFEKCSKTSFFYSVSWPSASTTGARGVGYASRADKLHRHFVGVGHISFLTYPQHRPKIANISPT